MKGKGEGGSESFLAQTPGMFMGKSNESLASHKGEVGGGGDQDLSLPRHLCSIESFARH